MNTPTLTLQLLVAKLKACPTRDTGCSQKALPEVWSRFRQFMPEQGDPVTPAVLAGLILHDANPLATLLNEAERAQLAALGKVALERYLDKTHPLNKLGKTLAAAIKESP